MNNLQTALIEFIEVAKELNIIEDVTLYERLPTPNTKYVTLHYLNKERVMRFSDESVWFNVNESEIGVVGFLFKENEIRFNSSLHGADVLNLNINPTLKKFFIYNLDLLC